MQLAFATFVLAFVTQHALATKLYDRAEALKKTLQANNLKKAGLPDPVCRTGVLSVFNGVDPQVCCASYCGECSDYPTCANVRGQDSAKACCASQVYEQRCGHEAPANVCLKPCAESLPPCIMESGHVFTPPNPNLRSAIDDCDTTVTDWRTKAEEAMRTPAPPPPAPANFQPRPILPPSRDTPPTVAPAPAASPVGPCGQFCDKENLRVQYPGKSCGKLKTESDCTSKYYWIPEDRVVKPCHWIADQCQTQPDRSDWVRDCDEPQTYCS